MVASSLTQVSAGHDDRAYRRQRSAVIAEAAGRCEIRGPHCSTIATTVDHVVALIDGGTHDRANLRAACAACNSAGGALITARRRGLRAIGRSSRRW
jgi:5-methylcytosine-specific restriction endonuclease McrA